MAWLAVDPGQMEHAGRGRDPEVKRHVGRVVLAPGRHWDLEVKQQAGRVGPAPGLQAQLQGLEESAA